MPHTREEHGDSVSVRRLYALLVAHATAGLHYRCDTILRRTLHAVAEGEETVRAHHQPLFADILTLRSKRFLCLLQRDTCRAHAVHLTGTHAKRLAVFHHHYSIRLHMLHDTPSKLQISQLLLCRLHLGNAHIRRDSLSRGVQLLRQQPAVHAHILHVRCGICRHIHLQQAQVLLRAEHLQRALREFWSHDDFQEDRLHQLCRLARYLAVGRYDAAEDAYLVRLVGFRPRVHHVLTYRCAARIHVLQAHAERHIAKLPHDIQRSVRILYIIITQLLTVQLLCRRQRERHRLRSRIELRMLVRVLTIAEPLLKVELKEEFLVQPRLLPHVGRDTAVVLRRVGVCLCRQAQTRLLGGVARGAHLAEDGVVIRRIAHNGYIIPVLRRRPQHRRSSYVNLLNRLSHRNALFGDGLAEGIEVNAHHINRFDTVLRQRLHMARLVPTRQQCPVHLRMKRLHAPVANLRETGYFTNADGLHALIFQEPLRATCGNHFPACRLQTFHKGHQARLVAYAN